MIFNSGASIQRWYKRQIAVVLNIFSADEGQGAMADQIAHQMIIEGHIDSIEQGLIDIGIDQGRQGILCSGLCTSIISVYIFPGFLNDQVIKAVNKSVDPQIKTRHPKPYAPIQVITFFRRKIGLTYSNHTAQIDVFITLLDRWGAEGSSQGEG